MRFLRAEIYGFGKWVDATFDLSKESFICIYGENESGKSTLQQFILYILFDLPPRKRQFFKPKMSHYFGGALTVETKQVGQFTIERVDDRFQVLLPDGDIADEAWLQQKMSGLTRDIYEAIYAFSALDLVDIREMKANELSEVLFSVGLTGSTSIYQLERKLTNELGKLYKKAGTKPLINEQIKQLTTKERALQDQKEKEGSYRVKREQKENLQTTIKEVEAKETTLRKKQLKYEKVLQMIPLLIEYETLTEALVALPKTILFPVNGIQRYEQVKNNLLPLQSEYQMLKENITNLKEEIEERKQLLFSDEHYPLAQQLISEKDTYQEHQRELRVLQHALEEKIADMEKHIHDLTLAPEEIEELFLPFHLEATWQEIAEMDWELRKMNEALAEEIQVIQEEQDRLEQETIQVEQALLADKDIASINQKLQADQYFHTSKQNDVMQQQKWGKWAKKRKQTAQKMMYGSFGLAVLLMMVSMFSDNNLLLIALMIGGLGAGQYFYTSYSLKQLQHIQEDEASVQTTPLSVTDRERYEILLRQQEQLQADQLLLEDQYQRLHAQKLQWEERKRLYHQRRNNVDDRIITERYQFTFLEDLQPAHWVDMLHMLTQVKDMQYEKGKLIKKINMHTDHCQHYEAQLASLQAELAVESLEIKDVEAMLRQHETAQEMMADKVQSLTEMQARRDGLLEELQFYQKEIDTLFTYATVENEESYFQVARQAAEKEQLHQQLQKISEQIDTMFGQEAATEVKETTYDKSAVEVSLQKTKEALADLQIMMQDAQKQLIAVQLEIKQLELDEHISALTYQVEIDKSALNEQAKKWAILKVAQTTLSEAKKSYQEKYLSAVISVTSQYFTLLTGGKYNRVFAPTAKQTFQVEGKNNIRYTVEELSQGTIDQLYVSLRLAVSKVMSEKFIIPLMIDDAFVHFDTKRTASVLQLIQDISEEQQVLLFTCKEDIANQLQVGMFYEKLKLTR